MERQLVHVAAEIAQVLDLQREAPPVRAACRWLRESYLCPAPRDPTGADLVRATLWQVKADPMQIVAALATMALYETRNPHHFRDDAHVTHHFGMAVARIARKHRRGTRLTPATLRDIGAKMRDTLAPLAYSIARAALELESRQISDLKVMRQPININATPQGVTAA